ncbi:hypothetical protein KOI35_36860 [Actinoplanes bogorensis]|uniref:Uncharacterized protein n=1 Tax=Paractinoplanes bogorensis TaxID=1610840 RepID=A0ABS5Z075_9ACTN|nr:hypothetical protein [Actinoplanes bogorensis]MBU2669099.1 hypothetical protein [Actinoplanes bogorensis]
MSSLLAPDKPGLRPRHLFAVVLPVVAAMVAVPALLDLAGSDQRQIILDNSADPPGDIVLAWAKLLVLVALWLIGLVGGVWAVVRGAGPFASWWKGIKQLPIFALGLIAAAGGTALATWAIAGAVIGPATLVLLIAVQLLGALVAVRILLAGIARVVGGPRPSWRQAILFLLGGVVLPAFLTYGLLRLDVPAVALVMIVVLAAQVSLAAAPHVRETGESRPPRLWPAVLVLVVAVLIPYGMTKLNLTHEPPIRFNAHGPSTAVAVAWPAGRHPVIATVGGAWFCDDDLCETFTDVSGGGPAVPGFGTATVGPDGAVIKTAVTGGPDQGGPFVQYGRCVREGCSMAWLPVRASAREKIDLTARTEVAGASAPDGALWLFVALSIPGKYKYSLIRCADVPCTAPQRHDIGVLDRTPSDGYSDGDRARLSIGADGRPSASFWLGHGIVRFTCDPVTCAAPKQSDEVVGPPDSYLVANGELRRGESSVPISGEAVAAVAAGSTVYVTSALPARATPGFHLNFGPEPQHWLQVLWRCDDRCTRTPLDFYSGDARKSLLAVAPDGRALIVRDDGIVLSG